MGADGSLTHLADLEVGACATGMVTANDSFVWVTDTCYNLLPGTVRPVGNATVRTASVRSGQAAKCEATGCGSGPWQRGQYVDWCRPNAHQRQQPAADQCIRPASLHSGNPAG